MQNFIYSTGFYISHICTFVSIYVCFCLWLSCVQLFCDPMDYSRPGSSVHGISQQEYWSGLPFLVQGIFLTQGSNPYFLHWQVDSLPLSHQRSPLYMSVYKYNLVFRFSCFRFVFNSSFIKILGTYWKHILNKLQLPISITWASRQK